MIVTINTDASFHPKHKVGAFAFWIVCNQGKIMHSGPLKSAKNSQEAEIQCIANALHVLYSSTFIGISHIIINSDALWAFSEIKNNAKPGSSGKKCADILRLLKIKFIGSGGPPIHEFRHVKAHSGKLEARKWVNDWCDRKAKEQLWILINKNLNSPES